MEVRQKNHKNNRLTVCNSNNNFNYMEFNNKIIGWWSGGITSAVACRLSIDLFGKENCRIIFIDTGNEDEDTYRFMKDCQKWYGLEIETIKSDKHEKIQDVWRKYKALNNANNIKR